MSLVSVKTVSVYSGVAHESVDTVDVNKDAIVMIKKVFYSIEKEIEENGETKKVLSPEAYYKVSFANGEAISLTETEKNKLQ
jgi:transcription elongation factor